jgi:hypothetical protein
MMKRKDLLTILACLESKEHNTEGRLDPRVPRDEKGRNLMTAVEMLDRIARIRMEMEDMLDTSKN